MLKPYSFTKWLNSPNAVSFSLAIGVVFLVSNYQGIIHRANPENLNEFVYPFWLQVILSHIDSLFFGLATAIIIFQSTKVWHKIVYCSFEGIMIFLNLNRNFIDTVGFNSQFLLATYIAIFSAFTLFFLGNLARQHNAGKKIWLEINPQQEVNHIKKGQTDEQAKLEADQSLIKGDNAFHSNDASHSELESKLPAVELATKTDLKKARAKRGKTINYKKVDNLLAKQLSASDIAKVMKCSPESIYRYIRENKNDKID